MTERSTERETMSSSAAPAIFSMSSVASSRRTSMTSSTVTMPRSLFAPSTTGTDTKPYRADFLPPGNDLGIDRPRLIDGARAEAIIAAIARRIERTIRPADTLAHLEGNCFACIVMGLREAGEAHDFAQRIQRALAEPVKFEGLEIAVSASRLTSSGIRT